MNIMRVVLFLVSLATFMKHTNAECGCIFNGNIYKPGQQIDGLCFTLTCTTNSTGGLFWSTNNTINSQCDGCRVSNDPHFYTFDCTKGYDWHGLCNYTFAAQITDLFSSEYEPGFAVYGDFQQCGVDTESSSCLDYTTYKADPFTAVTIDHSNPITSFVVNNDTYNVTNTPMTVYTQQYYPLIAWQYDFNCIRVQGPTFALEVCPWSIYIWVTPKYMNTLAGLCGYYNGDCKDDHTRRDGTQDKVKVNPTYFPLSWITETQQDRICPCMDVQPMADKRNPSCPKEQLNAYLDMCRMALNSSQLPEASLKLFRGDCVKDICANPKEANLWLQNAVNVVNTEEQVQSDFRTGARGN